MRNIDLASVNSLKVTVPIGWIISYFPSMFAAVKLINDPFTKAKTVENLDALFSFYVSYGSRRV